MTGTTGGLVVPSTTGGLIVPSSTGGLIVPSCTASNCWMLVLVYGPVLGSHDVLAYSRISLTTVW